MLPQENIAEILDDFREHQAHYSSFVDELFNTLIKKAEKDGDEKLKKFIEQEKLKLFVQTKKLDKKLDEGQTGISRELEKLTKEINTSISNNYLLEHQKKELMLITAELEDANDEISSKNRKLKSQKKQIEEQSQQLQTKNEELKQQNEHIMDQADYLFEANKKISTMHDEVQKQKDEILKKNEELISLNNEKNNLIGIVAHDLKSPLNQIKGLISIIKMRENEIDMETLGYIDIIENSASRLSELVNKILDVEAIESKKLNLKMEKVSLAPLIKDAVSNFKIISQEKKIQLHTDITAEECTAKVDKSYMTQILENLISNAIKFSPYYKNVYVKLSNEYNNLILEIKDEGPGISNEDQKKLFGKYQKLSAQPTGDELSTGLGLSIVKKYVESMKGQIWVDSKVGEGTSFFVSFKALVHAKQ